MGVVAWVSARTAGAMGQLRPSNRRSISQSFQISLVVTEKSSAFVTTVRVLYLARRMSAETKSSSIVRLPARCI